jgi:putative spermidine/putrescine transport system ATP-binding protein
MRSAVPRRGKTKRGSVNKNGIATWVGLLGGAVFFILNIITDGLVPGGYQGGVGGFVLGYLLARLVLVFVTPSRFAAYEAPESADSPGQDTSAQVFRPAAIPDPFLVLDGIDKSFGSLHVLDHVSIAVEHGEVLALLGPSGSGKTTLLRILAGFEAPDAGRVVVAGEEVTGLPPARRRFGMVFQHYALFPHLTVGANVAFGLESRGATEKGEVAARVAAALALVDLAGFEARRPAELSGGQQQRVALARALAIEPRLLLLDEPLSNLDPSLRERTRRELRRAVERAGITTVLVTHEQEEAFDLGDRVAVLHEGRLEQVGVPEELYEAPESRFVATFVGRAAVLAGRVTGAAAAGVECEVEIAGGDGARWRAVAAAPLDGGQPVEVVVRPEALSFAAEGGPAALPGRVVERRYAGAATFYRVELDGGALIEVLVAERDLATARARGEEGGAARVGERVGVVPSPATGPAPRAFPAGAAE